ncbi:hypothetical protein ACE939_01975 [Aquimarina sp. W85]|uniref:hypothetical protein n=1 Tax=Aquimarina rhodophyticola TaxID=3342246 RepID=UPI00366D6999
MNFKLYLFYFCLLNYAFLFAQIDANSVMGVPSGTTAEIGAITTAQEGAIVYDTQIKRMFQFIEGSWQEMLTAGNVYVGAFQINAAGTVNVTGIPFIPSSVTFVAHANVETFNLDIDNAINNDRGIRNSFGSMNGFARNDNGSITQQVIYVGGHGNSINDISRFASNTNAIGLRYGDQNGSSLGKITGRVTNFTADGFEVLVNYINGTITNTGNNVRPGDIADEGVIVLYTAYR